MQTLSVEILEDEQVPTVVLAGEADLAAEERMRDGLDRAIATDAARVDLDLTRLTFMDSTALALVLQADATLSEAGRSLGVICVEGPVLKLFSMTGLTEHLDVRDGLRTV